MVKINSKFKKKKEIKQQTASRRVSVESNSARREESKTVAPIKFSDYIGYRYPNQLVPEHDYIVL